MRCLHCGKELAVFKRLARQEFCSDDHRRQYREKYDQLALGRLLEEKPPEDGTQSGPKKNRGPITLGLTDVPAPAQPAPAQPTRVQPPPTRTPHAPAKDSPAAMAGILVAELIPTAVQTTARVAAEMELASSLAPEQPRQRFESPPAAFPQAAQVRFFPAARIQSSPGRTNEQRLEVRGFMRTAPLVEIHLNGSAATKLEAAKAALDVRIPPQFPSKEPALWTAPEREFASFRIESSSLGEPELLKTGLDGEPDRAVAVLEAQVVKAQVVEAQVVKAQVVEAPVLEHGVLKAQAENEPESMPERVTRPMPVTLHGVAAGKARPMQVFPALAGGTAVQAPRWEALPLRMLMILGPALKREIRLPELQLSSSVSSGLSRTVKASAGLVAVLALAAGFFFVKSNGGSAANAPLVEAGPPLPNAPDDWLQNFSPDTKRQRRVSLLRASGDLSDYRVEFESAIQSKAAGWVYRAKDPQNFYVSKLEIQKPGTEPAAVVAHYAVINGEELARTRVPLPRGSGADAVYKIRFQAVGNRFTTWVQDQKVDDWTDDRIKAGGAGLYSEDGEHAALRSSFKVVPLMRKK
jgi:hypothetical protein